ncbi:MAG: YjbQ family protein [Marinilabiliales bacterium]|nr:MAG: YjbQ family protein [Marinilabiliales bacterium]
MIRQYEITLPPLKRGYHAISHLIEDKLDDLPQSGMVNLFLRHTSAALTINENADPDVPRDLAYATDKLVPENDPGYIHTIEGPDDMPAHVKSSLLSVSVTIPVKNGRLHMGTWQGIFLCEFRNRAGSRKITATVWS